jgi:ubiquinone/menaquinone biosynthesis C-methylase UbiE
MIEQNVGTAGFDGLADNYERYRTGYSGELFDILEKLGMRRDMTVLDAGCGTGIAMQPLLKRGMAVTGLDANSEMLAIARTNLPSATFVAGRAEELPFADGSFDAAISAQSFHWFDMSRAYAELIRVVKPGGPVAVWWKMLGSDDPMRALRAAACKQAGVVPSADPLSGGFSAFYRAEFAQRTLRVLPFTARFQLDDWMGYERSRAAIRDAYGARYEAYLDALRGELQAKYPLPSSRIDVRYTQYLYVGATATS